MTAAIVSITLTSSSPTLQLFSSDKEDPFYLITTATIKSSTRPSSPITLHTGRFPIAVTALATVPPWQRTDLASPALQGHAIKGLVERGRKRVEWERFRTQWVPPRNLREAEGFTWATVPAEGELVVRHYLPREKLEECGVLAGEIYMTALDARVSSACPLWWTWGDLETDLKDKKFGYEGVKDGNGGIIHEGPEWAVNQSQRNGPTLRLEHGEETVQIEII